VFVYVPVVGAKQSEQFETELSTLQVERILNDLISRERTIDGDRPRNCYWFEKFQGDYRLHYLGRGVFDYFELDLYRVAFYQQGSTTQVGIFQIVNPGRLFVSVAFFISTPLLLAATYVFFSERMFLAGFTMFIIAGAVFGETLRRTLGAKDRCKSILKQALSVHSASKS
jgi:hypothetical protein